jgi:hypothetical protein
MQATQYSNITQCMKTASDEHGKEAKRWVARDASGGEGGGGGSYRLHSCYYKGHLEWEGGRLLNGFVEAGILISMYYADQNSI